MVQDLILLETAVSKYLTNDARSARKLVDWSMTWERKFQVMRRISYQTVLQVASDFPHRLNMTRSEVP